MIDDLITDRADDLVERRCAVFDSTRAYRYTLERHWGDARPAVFVMLNPSTADAFTEDPTIRRCIAFAKREGCGGLIVVNLFALRATDPKALYSHPDPVGPSNDGIVCEATRQGSPLVAAWGVHGVLHGREAGSGAASGVQRRAVPRCDEGRASASSAVRAGWRPADAVAGARMTPRRSSLPLRCVQLAVVLGALYAAFYGVAVVAGWVLAWAARALGAR